MSEWLPVTGTAYHPSAQLQMASPQWSGPLLRVLGSFLSQKHWLFSFCSVEHGSSRVQGLGQSHEARSAATCQPGPLQTHSKVPSSRSRQ